MKLCIPIEMRPEGGVYTFLGNWTRWLERTGRPFTRNLDDDYDVLFVNSWVVPASTVRRMKRERAALRVVQRVDGAAADYGGNLVADRVQARVNLLADVTIFQSEYSKVSTRQKFRVIAQDGPVIYNPVDINLFTPVGATLELPTGAPRVACASWSVNPRKGGSQIDALSERHPDVTFVLCGRFDTIASRANVVRLGHLSRDEMARALRSCDVFLNVSENETCPNVVLEALASGLPVLYRESGGVPELVGNCGEPITVDTFRPALDRVMAEPEHFARCARARVLERFSPDVICPQYWEAMRGAQRRPLPSSLVTLRLAREGYPVLPRLKSPRELAGAMARRAPAVVRTFAGPSRAARWRVGWATYDSFPDRKRRFSELDSFTAMRVANVANWINEHDADLANELYVPDRKYDLVVFQKVMDARSQSEAEKIKAYGGRVIFDANVNYYERWGDYFIPGTAPTDEQQRDAERMTRLADWVVADSTYLASIIRQLNPQVTWIPDNVDPGVYRGTRIHEAGGPLRLVWSGIGKKAAHLLEIRDVLAQLPGAQLTLVVDEPPSCLTALSEVIDCRLVRFAPRRYARTLLQSDVIISPKRLVNAYEMAHTEYKITLGMAVGLPAVASAQRSYIEAIEHRGAGIIAASADEWLAAFERLHDASVRHDLGERARLTVAERYATPVVAERYRAVLRQLVASDLQSATAAQ